MGNEFGHPEWIDFPREGNNWSCKYARRQWHLVDDPNLKYQFLARFDLDMIALSKKFKLLDTPGPNFLYEHSDHKVIIFERAGLVFAFNFHPHQSYSDYRLGAPAGRYQMILDSDAPEYGGHHRLVAGQEHKTSFDIVANRQFHLLNLYMPSRTVLVLQREKS
jgi:1,4-alpha-glucan branching enzyme